MDRVITLLITGFWAHLVDIQTEKVLEVCMIYGSHHQEGYTFLKSYIKQRDIYWAILQIARDS